MTRFPRNKLTLSLTLLLSLLASPSFAAELPGATCPTLGVSTMASDQKNLIVCLKNDRGNLIWKSMTKSGVPVGAIIAWPVTSNPDDAQNGDGTYNWLDCNGQSIDANLYPELFARIGGVVPNLQGKFLRGLGGQSAALGIDQTDALNGQTNLTALLYGIGTTTASTGSGGVDASAFCYATTTWTWESAQSIYDQCVANNSSSGSSQTVLGPSRSYNATIKLNTGATETRPINRSVRYLIRARS